MSAKLKAAEANIDEVRKYYEAKIATLIEEYEGKLGHVCYEASACGRLFPHVGLVYFLVPNLR